RRRSACPGSGCTLGRWASSTRRPATTWSSPASTRRISPTRLRCCGHDRADLGVVRVIRSLITRTTPRSAKWVAVGVVVALAALVGRHAPPRDPGAGDIVRVGVAEGASIPEYEQRSRAELARLSGTPSDVYALVTFRAYLPPDRLAPVLAGAPLLRVYA